MTPGAGRDHPQDPVLQLLPLREGRSRNYAATVDAECVSCPFWKRPYAHERDQEHGECRRRPPLPDGTWPVTTECEWCGAHPAMAGAPTGEWHDDEAQPNGGEYLWRKFA